MTAFVDRWRGLRDYCVITAGLLGVPSINTWTTLTPCGRHRWKRRYRWYPRFLPCFVAHPTSDSRPPSCGTLWFDFAPAPLQVIFNCYPTSSIKIKSRVYSHLYTKFLSFSFFPTNNNLQPSTNTMTVLYYFISHHNITQFYNTKALILPRFFEQLTRTFRNNRTTFTTLPHCSSPAAHALCSLLPSPWSPYNI